MTFYSLIHGYQCSAEPSAFMKNSDHSISKIKNLESTKLLSGEFEIGGMFNDEALSIIQKVMETEQLSSSSLDVETSKFCR
jgi:hypothetical protein